MASFDPFAPQTGGIKAVGDGNGATGAVASPFAEASASASARASNAGTRRVTPVPRATAFSLAEAAAKAAEASDGAVLRSGMLKKRTRHGMWQSRYAVLTTGEAGCLQYWKTRKLADAGQAPSGIVSAASIVSAVRQGDDRIEVQVSSVNGIAAAPSSSMTPGTPAAVSSSSAVKDEGGEESGGGRLFVFQASGGTPDRDAWYDAFMSAQARAKRAVAARAIMSPPPAQIGGGMNGAKSSSATAIATPTGSVGTAWPTISDGDVIFFGWLFVREGRFKKKWMRRFCVIRRNDGGGSMLCMYKRGPHASDGMAYLYDAAGKIIKLEDDEETKKEAVEPVYVPRAAAKQRAEDRRRTRRERRDAANGIPVANDSGDETDEISGVDFFEAAGGDVDDLERPSPAKLKGSLPIADDSVFACLGDCPLPSDASGATTALREAVGRRMYLFSVTASGGKASGTFASTSNALCDKWIAMLKSLQDVTMKPNLKRRGVSSQLVVGIPGDGALAGGTTNTPSTIARGTTSASHATSASKTTPVSVRGRREEETIMEAVPRRFSVFSVPPKSTVEREAVGLIVKGSIKEGSLACRVRATQWVSGSPKLYVWEARYVALIRKTAKKSAVLRLYKNRQGAVEEARAGPSSGGAGQREIEVGADTGLLEQLIVPKSGANSVASSPASATGSPSSGESSSRFVVVDGSGERLVLRARNASMRRDWLGALAFVVEEDVEDARCRAESERTYAGSPSASYTYFRDRLLEANSPDHGVDDGDGASPRRSSSSSGAMSRSRNGPGGFLRRMFCCCCLSNKRRASLDFADYDALLSSDKDEMRDSDDEHTAGYGSVGE